MTLFPAPEQPHDQPHRPHQQVEHGGDAHDVSELGENLGPVGAVADDSRHVDQASGRKTAENDPQFPAFRLRGDYRIFQFIACLDQRPSGPGHSL